ncbi:unnamed protein product (macronuclear) [Paramecium tetraurelia]|uniref:MORN repeat protein n=1 Tax=Paramecium tetraurelia TaxID=5888 RepID=A0E5U8_PARTE|nr:uncharacterized protein GSPATT00003527001 [Paramecium tetraurelia]CAK90665.1 unnamed protein product [Paramecium tetraurelia]|eukprot:XP_001458062.1 hypothetical protein (macronuclear) [Paramecium tetraurelia strain d4-2]
MEQVELPFVFCQQHNDYMIEVVCYDYLSQQCRFMCKQCYRQNNNSNTQQRDSEFQQRQQQFQQKCTQEKGQLNNYLQQKIELLFGEFKAVIQSHLENIQGSFRNSLQQIDNFVPQLSNLNQQDAQKTIEKQRQKINELRKESIKNKSNQLNELKNKIIQIALNIENLIFSEHLLGQQLYQIPDLQTIFKNFDTNNLLLSFEQNYHIKYQYITELDIENRMDSQKQELERILKRNRQIQTNLNDQYQKIDNELQKQKDQMLARFKKYQNWVITNNEQINQNIQKAQLNTTEIQMLAQQDFINLGLVDLANKKLNNSLDEFRNTLSKICHLGFYDIKISLQDIETNFMLNLIPIRFTQGISPMQSNILNQYRDATNVKANLNQNGDIYGQVLIKEPSATITVQVSSQEKQEGDSIKNYQNQTLFDFNLLKFFPDSQNKFSYQLKRTQLGVETYDDNINQWSLKKQNNGKYKFTVVVNQRDQIIFEDIEIRDNKLEQNSSIIVRYSDSRNQYEGQINNNFQYSGKGKLIENGIIKDGIWKNGQLDGIGIILQNGIEIYNGNFENGMKQGNGREFLISDLYYDGQFERDEKHGVGKIVKKKGQEFITVEEKIKWKNGQSQNDVCKIF